MVLHMFSQVIFGTKVDYFNLLIFTTKNIYHVCPNYSNATFMQRFFGKTSWWVISTFMFRLHHVHRFNCLFKNVGLRYLHTSVTIDYGSIIDHMYTNIPLSKINFGALLGHTIQTINRCLYH